MRPAIKADFIRRHASEVPTKTLQRLAKQAGLGTLGTSYIDKVRRDMAAEQAPAERKRPAARTAAPAATAVSAAGDPERQLRAIVVVLGTKRVREIIDQLEAQLIAGQAHG